MRRRVSQVEAAEAFPKWTGARRLAYEVLLAAIDDLRKPIGNWHIVENVNARASARAFINSNDRDWPFSFVRICEYMKLDPTYVRRIIKERKERYLRYAP